MKNINSSEIAELIKIKNAIDGQLPVEKIESIIRSIQPNLIEKKFAKTFAACLLANHHREKEAIEFFAMNPEDTFCMVMNNFIMETGEFRMVGKVFKDARPFHIYTQTPLYRAHEKALVENITKFTKNSPPPAGETVTIIDIGPGDGELTSQYVNHVINQYDLKKVRLVFIDPFEDQLNLAAKKCRQRISIDCEIKTICSRIQELSEKQITEIRALKPVWFIVAALSVHHMPEEQKIPMLRLMRTISNYFVLAEVNWNHDLPEKDSPELIWSVSRNYGFICKDVLELPIGEEERKLCLYHFLVDEAINILKQDRPNRIDYHTPIEEWIRIANTAGFKNSKPVSTYMFDDEPFIFMMEFYN